MFSRQKVQPPRVVFLLSLGLFFRTMYLHQGFFLCILLGPHSQGMTMFVLHFLYLVRPYPWDVGDACFYLSCTLLGLHSLVWQCLVYFFCTSLGHTSRTLAISSLLSCSVCLHCACYIYIYIYKYTYLLVDGCALCMMDSQGQESNFIMIMGAPNLEVWVCTKGNCCRCIFMLCCVHDPHGMIVSIHVSQ